MRLPFLILSVAATLSAQATKPQKPRKPSSRPAKATSRPTSRPARAKGPATAIALAEKVVAFAGGQDGWRKVDNIVFTFFGFRRLYWDVRAGKVRIETIARRGRDGGGALIYDIGKGEGTSLTKGPSRGATRSGKGAWINDFYWLLVPLKVLDPGVRLSIDDAREGDEDGLQRLRLRFDAVGLTPKNEYVLHVESKTGKVTQWDFYRDAKAKPRSWKFADYRKVGPLRLSLSRPNVGGRGAAKLSDVAINVKPPKDIWTAEGKVLEKLK